MTDEEVRNSRDHDLIIEIYTYVKTTMEDVKEIKQEQKEAQKTISEDHQRLSNLEDGYKEHLKKDNIFGAFGGFGIVIALLLDFIKLKP